MNSAFVNTARRFVLRRRYGIKQIKQIGRMNLPTERPKDFWAEPRLIIRGINNFGYGNYDCVGINTRLSGITMKIYEMFVRYYELINFTRFNRRF